LARRVALIGRLPLAQDVADQCAVLGDGLVEDAEVPREAGVDFPRPQLLVTKPANRATAASQ
jgi:hypothetical protein